MPRSREEIAADIKLAEASLDAIQIERDDAMKPFNRREREVDDTLLALRIEISKIVNGVDVGDEVSFLYGGDNRRMTGRVIGFGYAKYSVRARPIIHSYLKGGGLSKDPVCNYRIRELKKEEKKS